MFGLRSPSATSSATYLEVCSLDTHAWSIKIKVVLPRGQVSEGVSLNNSSHKEFSGEHRPKKIRDVLGGLK